MLKSTPHKLNVSSVALIGVDGAGKTSVAKAISESGSLPVKYMYMGVNIESSNYALPTSRLAHRIKVYLHKKSLSRSGRPIPDNVHLHGLEHRHDRRGKLGAILRLVKRVSEESYRQLISWIFQWRGYIVLYDRHYLYDGCPPPNDPEIPRLTDRLHNWFLRRVYPRPGLVIFLDAAPELLFERKQEVPTEYLAANRKKLLQKRAYARQFVIVDATKPLPQTIAEVQRIIAEHCIDG